MFIEICTPMEHTALAAYSQNISEMFVKCLTIQA